jgi:isoleucyl-tRNA synthetase
MLEMKSIEKFSSRDIEERVLDWWEKEKIYELIKKSEPKDKKFFFLDGPPYTTGDVHIGTAWNKILKDYIIKYKRMQGYRVTDTPGYDTHGLPIEVVIEKQLGIKDKKEIIKYGLDNFINKCRNFAESKIGDMNEQFKRLGCAFWNWDNPYITLKNTYIQGIWWTLKKAWENGYLYKFYKPQNCCPRCATALAKHEFEYENIQDTAIFVKFQSVEDPKTFYVIWTTTPWTLVSNTNIMVNPDLEYVKMRVKDEYWIMGIASTADLLQNKLGLTLKTEDGFEYGERYTGLDLEGKKYIHPLADEVPRQAELEKEQAKVHTIVLSREYVQEAGGSGMVHTAPGHGPEDFEVGIENGIPIFSPVDMRGEYTEEAGKYVGKYVHEVNQQIIDELTEKGTLVHAEKIIHEYAHCWRCKTKLVYRATGQWFFKTSALREKMLAANEEIYWIPEFAGKTNFKNWLTSLQDWCISRQRYWGVPLSIWICDDEECKNMDVIGSAAELKEKAGTCPDDLHRPGIDAVTWQCPKCSKGTMRRIPDILDVWLDSGSVMWASQLFVDGKEHYDSWEPADFILEGKDQIRGWFNSLMCSAMVSSKRKNYKACYMHGWVTSHGTKMSKSLGNAIAPSDIIDGKIEILSESEKKHLREQAARQKTSKFDKTKTEKKSTKKSKKRKERKKKYIKDDKRWSNINGIETFRFYSVMGTQAGRDLNFDYKEYTDTFKVLNTFWNSYLFAQEKMNLNKFEPKKNQLKIEELDLADKWIVSRVNTLVKDITELFEKYFLPAIPARLQDFILNDLSRWYITLIRDKVDMNSEPKAKTQALSTLWYVLHKLCLIMAPVVPMLTEELYQNMFKDHIVKPAKSIHLETWPKVDTKYISQTIEDQMQNARQIIDEVRSLKTESKIKLRWPTKSLSIMLKEKAPKLEFLDLIQDMSNVKEVLIIKKELSGENIKSTESTSAHLYLDLEDSKELQQERIIRDLFRTLQSLRKQNKLQTGEEIELYLSSSNDFLLETLETMKDGIIAKVTAAPLVISEKNLEEESEFAFHEFHVCTQKGCYAMIRDKNYQKVIKGKGGNCGYCEDEYTEDCIGTIQIKFKKK